MKKRKFDEALVLLSSLGLAITLLGGCSGIGNAAAGPDEATIKKTEDSLPPQKQIQMIQSSPMPAEQKKQRIAEIEQKYGVKADSPTPTPGAPAGASK